MTPDHTFKGAPLDYAVLIAYFVAIVGFGVLFGKYTRNTRDFFFGGQRFAWWLIAFSAIATTVGSYSFVKYSQVGFAYGLASSQTYLNDWFWIPILLLVWLPILYYGRIQSVPEYFERRFGRPSRMAATGLILLYLVGYVGVNLYTLGQVLNTLLGWPVMMGAVLSAMAVMVYMFAGGQTSVIMTDLAQGIILLIAGLGLFAAGIWHLGGFGEFWALLPQSNRFAFSEFNRPDDFSFIGIFAQDGLANSGAFVLMNQGMIMRFMAIRTVADARKMAICWILILSPLAAITVSSGGWIARALMENGELTTTGKDAFIDAAHFLCAPGVFGFVLAALTAALMSTADTLITAVSAIFVNDIYRPHVRPDAADRHYLNVARVTSLTTGLFGIGLVPVFMMSQSIYKAHAMFTAAVTPPIVVAILLGILWRRYTPAAAFATIVAGLGAVFLSFIPAMGDLLIGPFSFGMGPDSYDFTRALYGLAVCAAIGVGVTFFTKPRAESALVGLVTGTQVDAMRRYKGSEPNRREGGYAYLQVVVDESITDPEAAVVPREALDVMAAEIGDLIYVCDRRWWYGGLRSVHLKVTEQGGTDSIRIGPEARASARFSPGDRVYAEKIF
ncbi:MAG: sodium/solute symporter [Candidatus Hydrogenedentes bacterium]|nr:sodium/solute symporter [Candidatus Hydrogenedentota bacterium]